MEEKLAKENRKYVNIFKDWLEEQGLAKKTIKGHVSNAELFLLDYIPYYNEFDGDFSLDQTVTYIDDFIGYFFIHKCMWSTEGTVKGLVASMKKFYKSMLEKRKISKEAYDELLRIISECMDYWIEHVNEFNDEDSEYWDEFCIYKELLA